MSMPGLAQVDYSEFGLAGCIEKVLAAEESLGDALTSARTITAKAQLILNYLQEQGVIPKQQMPRRYLNLKKIKWILKCRQMMIEAWEVVPVAKDRLRDFMAFEMIAHAYVQSRGQSGDSAISKTRGYIAKSGNLLEGEAHFTRETVSSVIAEMTRLRAQEKIDDLSPTQKITMIRSPNSGVAETERRVFLLDHWKKMGFSYEAQVQRVLEGEYAVLRDPSRGGRLGSVEFRSLVEWSQLKELAQAIFGYLQSEGDQILLSRILWILMVRMIYQTEQNLPLRRTIQQGVLVQRLFLEDVRLAYRELFLIDPQPTGQAVKAKVIERWAGMDLQDPWFEEASLQVALESVQENSTVPGPQKREPLRKVEQQLQVVKAVEQELVLARVISTNDFSQRALDLIYLGVIMRGT